MSGFQQNNYKAWKKHKKQSVKRKRNHNQTQIQHMLELSHSEFKITMMNMLRELLQKVTCMQE